MKYLIVILFIPLSASAQTVSVSPMSFKAWGQSPGMAETSIHIKGFGLHYFQPHYPDNVYEFTDGKKLIKSKVSSNFALSYRVAFFREIVSIGPIVFPTPFPAEDCSRLNFFLDIGIPIKNFKISYRHISNGFGLFNYWNVGYDTITFSASLK